MDKADSASDGDEDIIEIKKKKKGNICHLFRSFIFQIADCQNDVLLVHQIYFSDYTLSVNDGNELDTAFDFLFSKKGNCMFWYIM